jgi:LytS/YehU family sensor histidine kinase
MIYTGDEKLISVETEIQICKDYLLIMKTRYKKESFLICKGIMGDEMIPPFIFHTIIENAFKHNAEFEFEFLLEKLETKKSIQYILRTIRKQEVLVKQTQKESLQEGIGFQYIRIKLKEVYGSSFRLEYSFETESIFKVEILIFK